jgi:response regulator of citrate/malate metabolism
MIAGLPRYHACAFVHSKVDSWLCGFEEGKSVISVLLVDDMPEVLEVLELMFLHHNQAVKVIGKARNKDQADDILQNNTVDLISIDIHMGEHTGFDLCRTVHRTLPHTFITICSADGTEENKKLALSCGAHYFLQKPVDLGCVEQLLEEYHDWKTKREGSHFI